MRPAALCPTFWRRLASPAQARGLRFEADARLRNAESHAKTHYCLTCAVGTRHTRQTMPARRRFGLQTETGRGTGPRRRDRRPWGQRGAPVANGRPPERTMSARRRFALSRGHVHAGLIAGDPLRIAWGGNCIVISSQSQTLPLPSDSQKIMFFWATFVRS